jgi:DNA repair protein RecO (recombination protein O)
MPLYTSDALILRTYKLGDADRIVVFLTRDRGKKRGVAKGARRTRSRFMGALEPLTEVKVAYFEKERRELVSLNYAEVGRSPFSADRGDALAHIGYFAELIDEWAPEASPDERLYRLGASVVDALMSGAPVEALARYFEYWLLRLQGVYPSQVACHRCQAPLGAGIQSAYLSVEDRQFTCERCAPLVPAAPGGVGPQLSMDALYFLQQSRQVGPDRVGEIHLSKDAARELERVHRMLIVLHLEKELRSTRVLRSLRS